MGLLNLTLGQLLAVFLPLAGMLVALYFYDRSRRRVVVFHQEEADARQ